MTKKLTGADVAWMADLTSTAAIANYVHWDPAITTCFEVDASLNLEDVAAAFLNGDQDIDLIMDWHSCGMLVMGIPDDLGAACFCVRVEPYYLFKTTGERYE